MTGRPLKIVFVITNLGTGGAELMLLKLLQNIDRRRFDPTVISLMGLGDVGPKIRAVGIPLHALHMSSGLLSLVKFIRLFFLFIRIKPDLVHSWMYHADLLAGLAARLSGCRNVFWSIRQSNLSPSANKPSTLFVIKACAVLSRWLPSRIISCSKRACETHIAIGYPMDKIQVIPNGFELSRFLPNESFRFDVRRELGLHFNSQLVGLIARFDPQKNHFGFLEAAKKIHQKIPNVHFLLAGSGVTASNLALVETIRKSNLVERMHLLGRREDIPRLMASLDVLVSSSHGEAFPNVLGEAMACGVPCVVTDVGDSAEIVGKSGCVVPADDMLGLSEGVVEMLRLSSEDRITLSIEARQRVYSEYEIRNITRLYEASYFKAVEEICVG